MKKLLLLLLALSVFFAGCGEVPIVPDEPAGPTVPEIPEYPDESPFFEGDVPLSDPYVDVTKEEFYQQYVPALSYEDAMYRTKHNFMSGCIADQYQAPTLSAYRPEKGGFLVKNQEMDYSPDGNTYYVYDAYGNLANKIYKDAAYITLEEVAAYVFAFGNVPANYMKGKNGDPGYSEWGIYLRCNNNVFSGNTKKYPYEPVLPRISGCGGDLQYYEIDIGTTGTDCDDDFVVRPYNDGERITRGAARIVYARYDANDQLTDEIAEKFVFYTYNHYNDFQEYLNYEGGWGDIFGNITGGGTLSSKTHYNPTPYILVTLSPLKQAAAADLAGDILAVAVVYPPVKWEMCS